MPPRSTNAPKLTTDETTPGRISPGLRLVRNSSRCSRWVSSRYARRDKTTLLRFLSSSMILHSSVRPTNGCRSRTRRRSTSDAGRKPRSPMSRMSPPLTTSMTGPETISSFSFSASIVPQARSYWARFLERISRPSLSSLVRTRASSSSSSDTTSCGSTSLRIESSREGMTPSDLYPMSRSTSSLSILTTVPLTMSPSSNSTIVASTASENDCPSRSSKTTGASGSRGSVSVIVVDGETGSEPASPASSRTGVVVPPVASCIDTYDSSGTIAAAAGAGSGASGTAPGWEPPRQATWSRLALPYRHRARDRADR